MTPDGCKIINLQLAGTETLFEEKRITKTVLAFKYFCLNLFIYPTEMLSRCVGITNIKMSLLNLHNISNHDN